VLSAGINGCKSSEYLHADANIYGNANSDTNHLLQPVQFPGCGCCGDLHAIADTNRNSNSDFVPRI
jgi:hypothetical protein